MSKPLSLVRPRRMSALALTGGLAALASVAAVAAPLDTVPVPAATVRAPVATPKTASALDPLPLSERLIVAASIDDVEPAPELTEGPGSVRNVWDDLADCESGAWLGGGGFATGSANWGSTRGFFEGGLQFHPTTWDAFRDADMPASGYDATREQQIVVGERVLAAQGWRAWPVCSRKLGLR